ncbi:MAG: hypothetical protein AVDCRST_MAG30-2150, partial [uncultured Solirubrobacteraceae bacterium]
ADGSRVDRRLLRPDRHRAADAGGARHHPRLRGGRRPRVGADRRADRVLGGGAPGVVARRSSADRARAAL